MTEDAERFVDGFQTFIERSLVLPYKQQLDSLMDLAGYKVRGPIAPDDLLEFLTHNLNEVQVAYKLKKPENAKGKRRMMRQSGEMRMSMRFRHSRETNRSMSMSNNSILIDGINDAEQESSEDSESSDEGQSEHNYHIGTISDREEPESDRDNAISSRTEAASKRISLRSLNDKLDGLPQLMENFDFRAQDASDRKRSSYIEPSPRRSQRKSSQAMSVVRQPRKISSHANEPADDQPKLLSVRGNDLSNSAVNYGGSNSKSLVHESDSEEDITKKLQEFSQVNAHRSLLQTVNGDGSRLSNAQLMEMAADSLKRKTINDFLNIKGPSYTGLNMNMKSNPDFMMKEMELGLLRKPSDGRVIKEQKLYKSAQTKPDVVLHNSNVSVDKSKVSLQLNAPSKPNSTYRDEAQPPVELLSVPEPKKALEKQLSSIDDEAMVNEAIANETQGTRTYNKHKLVHTIEEVNETIDRSSSHISKDDSKNLEQENDTLSSLSNLAELSANVAGKVIPVSAQNEVKKMTSLKQQKMSLQRITTHSPQVSQKATKTDNAISQQSNFNTKTPADSEAQSKFRLEAQMPVFGDNATTHNLSDKSHKFDVHNLDGNASGYNRKREKKQTRSATEFPLAKIDKRTGSCINVGDEANGVYTEPDNVQKRGSRSFTGLHNDTKEVNEQNIDQIGQRQFNAEEVHGNNKRTGFKTPKRDNNVAMFKKEAHQAVIDSEQQGLSNSNASSYNMSKLGRGMQINLLPYVENSQDNSFSDSRPTPVKPEDSVRDNEAGKSAFSKIKIDETRKFTVSHDELTKFEDMVDQIESKDVLFNNNEEFVNVVDQGVESKQPAKGKVAEKKPVKKNDDKIPSNVNPVSKNNARPKDDKISTSVNPVNKNTVKQDSKPKDVVNVNNVKPQTVNKFPVDSRANKNNEINKVDNKESVVVAVEESTIGNQTKANAIISKQKDAKPNIGRKAGNIQTGNKKEPTPKSEARKFDLNTSKLRKEKETPRNANNDTQKSSSLTNSILIKPIITLKSKNTDGEIDTPRKSGKLKEVKFEQSLQVDAVNDVLLSNNEEQQPKPKVEISINVTNTIIKNSEQEQGSDIKADAIDYDNSEKQTQLLHLDNKHKYKESINLPSLMQPSELSVPFTSVLQKNKILSSENTGDLKDHRGIEVDASLGSNIDDSAKINGGSDILMQVNPVNYPDSVQASDIRENNSNVHDSRSQQVVGDFLLSEQVDNVKTKRDTLQSRNLISREENEPSHLADTTPKSRNRKSQNMDLVKDIQARPTIILESEAKPDATTQPIQEANMQKQTSRASIAELRNIAKASISKEIDSALEPQNPLQLVDNSDANSASENMGEDMSEESEEEDMPSHIQKLNESNKELIERITIDADMCVRGKDSEMTRKENAEEDSIGQSAHKEVARVQNEVSTVKHVNRGSKNRIKKLGKFKIRSSINCEKFGTLSEAPKKGDTIEAQETMENNIKAVTVVEQKKTNAKQLSTTASHFNPKPHKAAHIAPINVKDRENDSADRNVYIKPTATVDKNPKIDEPSAAVNNFLRKPLQPVKLPREQPLVHLVAHKLVALNSSNPYRGKQTIEAALPRIADNRTLAHRAPKAKKNGRLLHSNSRRQRAANKIANGPIRAFKASRQQKSANKISAEEAAFLAADAEAFSSPYAIETTNQFLRRAYKVELVSTHDGFAKTGMAFSGKYRMRLLPKINYN